MRSLIVTLLCVFYVGTSYSQDWVEMQFFPEATARHHPVSFTINDTAYLLTGSTAQSNPNGTNDFFRYIPETDTWERLDDFPGPGRSFAYGATYNGKGYFGFGREGTLHFDDLWEFDPVTGEWNELTSCPCSGRKHPAFVPNDGKIFMGLGDNSSGNLNDWWEYNIEEDSWTRRDNLPADRRHHPFHFQAGDYVYVGMGHGLGGEGGMYDDWFRYDHHNHEWIQMNDFPGTPRVAGQEFSYDGYGYIISGDGPFHNNLEEGEFWKYYHEDDEWVRLPDHPGNAPDGRVGRWAPGAFAAAGNAYFFGGVNYGGSIMYSDFWAFDLSQYVNLPAEDFSNKTIRIYPNPASDVISFKGDLPEGSELSVSIFDARGAEVKSVLKYDGEISVDGLPEGLYLLNARTENGEEFRARFVVR